MLKRILCLLTITLLASSFVFSQVTTSSITGSVKDASNQPLTGATITAIHTPSGTTYTTVAGKNGVFTLPNVRIGGPYTVTVTFTGQTPYKVEGINLELGQPYNINAILGEQVQNLETVVVAGGRSRRAALDKTGASTNVNSRQIATLPTISRSITDFTRITPQANGTGFAGRDPRYNNVQVDGANLNNNFGLSNDPLPGGGSSPISIDALDEINVNISPVDVRQANFTGAGISAVTRSGDNTFKGSIYGYYRDQSYNGTTTAGVKLPPLVKTSNKIYGARVGGPIIRNKLFFFVNAEVEKRDFPSTPLRPSPKGSGPNASSTPYDSLAKLSAFLKSQYGYETGAYDNIPSFNSNIRRIIGRVDWNITTKHRLTLKYSDFTSETPNNSIIINGTSIPGGGGSILSTGTSTVSISRLGNNRFSQNSYGFENSNYGFTDLVKTGTIELNSRFSNRFANQFLGTITKIKDTRTFKGGVFPTIDFLNLATPTTALNNANYMTAGMDPFTNNNDVINDVYSVTDNVSYYSGRHTVTGGISYEYQRVGNQFMPGSNSYYLYRSLNDFITNQPPVYFALTYSLKKGEPAPYAADMRLGQLGVYLQDEMQVNSKLKLTAGLRVDKPIYLDQPDNNNAFSALTFQDKDGNPVKYTTQFPKGKLYWSPRVGFRWDAEGDKKMIIRGSLGLYTGRIPFVYLTNIPQNSGIIQNTAAVFNTVANPTATSTYLFNKDPNHYTSTFPQTAGTTILPNATFAAANKDFRFPQVMRSDLAYDQNLGKGFSMTLEAIYTKDINAVYIRNANLPAPNGNLVGADTRPRYVGTNANRINSNISGAYVLENTSKGGSFSLTAMLNKNFAKGFYGSVAYTYTFATDVTANPGQQAPSVWNSNPQHITANTLEGAYSNFAVPHRVVANLSYRFEYLKYLATTVSLFYEGSSDGNISYTYSGDVNGDGNGFDLVYIPANKSEINFVNTTINGVTYTPDQQWEILNAFINNDKYLSKHRGQYAERNGGKLPWYNRVDAKIMQDIFANIGKRRHTIQFSVDILNLPNLINHDWGAHKSAVLRNLLVPNNTFASNGAPQYRINSANNQPWTTPYQDVISTSGTYGIQLGLRYSF